MDDAELQRAIKAACFDEEADFSALPPRMAVYRRLVRNTLEGVTHKLLPRTREHMGEDFDRDIARFLAERGPRTHYLRDVPQELVAWASERWLREGRARWLADLARHEIASFTVSVVPYVAEPRAAEVALDRPLLLTSLMRIERFAWAVHEPAAPPPDRDVALLYHRDREHALRTLELSPLAAALLERAHLPLKDAIAAACDATGVAMNDETLASIARLLADLGERGILLGARES
ncbi:MAG TPA: putative DNA-binding domain-containing protein [Polyangiaceae bacterium]|jgi:hypothetical protein